MAAPQRIGKYQITAEIGSGGFGRVYSAQDPSVGRVVAIKVMNAPGDVDLVRRFRSEAMTVAMLAHKNIVTVHDYGEYDGAPYLVMEYLEGVNLQDLIRQGTLSLMEKVEIMIEAAEGLHCAHRQGITHRDVKPANIMRLADGTVKIMDFGIARIARESANRLTQTGFIVGTWSYMAPEQFNGTSDPQTDIFAFGVTLYELLTGHNPFNAPDPAGVFARITGSDPPPVSSTAHGVPEDLDRLVQKAIAKDRLQRYANLQDLIIDAKPILFDLSRAEAVQVYSKASQLLSSGQLDAAQSAVRKTLELDPTHSGARQLRTQIEREMQRRDSAAKAGTLIEKAEKEVREHQFREASETLASVRSLVPQDSPLQTRVMRIDAQIENAKRVAKLLDVARDNLRRLDYTEAFRSVTEALAADPGNDTGMKLLEEVRTGMTLREAKRRMQEELTRAEGLLLTGETEQALGVLRDLERSNSGAPEVVSLRQRAEAQWADESRRLRLANGVAECKGLVRNQQFEDAIAKANSLLADFPEATELQNLLRHATERQAAKKRAEQIARLKSEAAAYVSRQEFDFAIKLLETGVAKWGDDGELTRLLQSAIAGKEATERAQQMSETVDQARRLRRERKYDEALGAVERAIQAFGQSQELEELLRDITAEKRDNARREVARRAQSAIDQNNPETAITGLREFLKRYGEDGDIRRLVEAAENRIRERERNQRVQGVLAAAQQLIAERRWPEAIAKLDDGLRQAPGDAVLIAERKKAQAAQDTEQREQENARREREEALRRQENARREHDIAKTVLEAQSAREKGLAEAATEILNAAFLKHGRDEALERERQKLAESMAERQRAEALDKACAEARGCLKQSRFEEGLRILDAAEIRYPRALPLAALRAEIEQERAAFRRKDDIDQALAKAADLVQQAQLKPARDLLEDALRSYPDARGLQEAASRIRTRIEEEEKRSEIANITGQISVSIANRDWNRAVSQATGAHAKFPVEEIARLKRQAEDGKQQKEIEDAEAGILKARQAGNLDLAAELATAARIRWKEEKRFSKLEDEIQEIRGELTIAEARKQAEAGKFDQAEQLARQVLKRRPNFVPANDLLADIGARREAKKQLQAREAEAKAVAKIPSDEKEGRKKWFILATIAGLIIAILIVWKISQPGPQVKHETASNAIAIPPAQPGAGAGIPPATPVQPTPLTPTPSTPTATKESAGSGDAGGKSRHGSNAPPDGSVSARGNGGKTESKPRDTRSSETAAPTANQQATPPLPTQPAPRSCKPFNWANYEGDITSGDLTWSGVLNTNEQVTIKGRTATQGKATGEPLRKLLPVQLSIAPGSITVVSGPSAGNCFDAPLIVKNTGAAVQSFTIHWEALAH